MEKSAQLVVLGVVGKPFGIQGALKLSLANPDSGTLRKGLKVKLSGVAHEGDLWLTVENVKPGDRIKFVELSDRNRAEFFRGAEVSVLRDDLPRLPANEFYLGDMIGFKALDMDYVELGEVTGFYDTGAQIVLQIKTVAGHTAEVPYVKQIVPSVNMEQKLLILDPPRGLLDDPSS